ncbi:proteoglycan 4-like [Mya arenaria]|uniref:proteoglycan 4-like n=1 Tax=Mya arenaria TaxID=6604 RepID=UPI0022E76F1F|nr:proteoglycan 4-like [Mya arenaria]
MDESLDDYISKTNFKVQFGNPSYKSNQLGGQSRKRITPNYQSSRVTDVSITVPAVRKTGSNQNRTNQMRDAREKLTVKTHPTDARQKLIQKAKGTDARQKLITIRANKEPVDARTKLVAKKRIHAPGAQAQTQAEDFTLTRTVSNRSTVGNNIQLTPGPQGKFSITKTLTKVMPPGYETVSGGSGFGAPPTVTRRLGPPTGTTITRTVPNPSTQPPQAPKTQQYLAPNVPQTIQPVNLPYPPAQLYPRATYIQPPATQEPYQTPTSTYPPQPVYQALPPSIPPQPSAVNVPMGSNYQVNVSSQGQMMPKIQVHNDQYRPPVPAAYAPAQQQYTPQPQYASPQGPQYMLPSQQAPSSQAYAYTQPPQSAQPMYYQPAPVNELLVKEEPLDEEVDSQPIHKQNFSVKTIMNDTHTPTKPVGLQSSALKRKSPAEPLRFTTNSGPLKTSSSSYVPIIDTVGIIEPAKKGKFTKISGPDDSASAKLPIQRKAPLEDDDENVISPLQGFRISITNLAHTVTQDDIIELFGAVGAVKSVKLLKRGMADVIYVKREDAINATKTYSERELDGRPMVVKTMTPMSARIKDVSDKVPASAKVGDGQPLVFNKKPRRQDPSKVVEVGTLHRALFKTGVNPSSKPITFTVNI